MIYFIETQYVCKLIKITFRSTTCMHIHRDTFHKHTKNTKTQQTTLGVRERNKPRNFQLWKIKYLPFQSLTSDMVLHNQNETTQSVYSLSFQKSSRSHSLKSAKFNLNHHNKYNTKSHLYDTNSLNLEHMKRKSANYTFVVWLHTTHNKGWQKLRVKLSNTKDIEKVL